mgnify:CR=1 FL=1
MTWIGLHYHDIQSLKLPDSVKQPFSKMDRIKCRSLKKWYCWSILSDSHPFVQTNEVFRRELEYMIQSEMKAELESVYCHGIEYFSKTYIKEKVLKTLQWIVCYSSSESSNISSWNNESEIFHTWTVWSFPTEEITPSSCGFHLTSLTRSVWPWCVNSNSADPSSSSSALCSCPIYSSWPHSSLPSVNPKHSLSYHLHLSLSCFDNEVTNHHNRCLLYVLPSNVQDEKWSGNPIKLFVHLMNLDNNNLKSRTCNEDIKQKWVVTK